MGNERFSFPRGFHLENWKWRLFPHRGRLKEPLKRHCTSAPVCCPSNMQSESLLVDDRAFLWSEYKEWFFPVVGNFFCYIVAHVTVKARNDLHRKFHIKFLHPRVLYKRTKRRIGPAKLHRLLLHSSNLVSALLHFSKWTFRTMSNEISLHRIVNSLKHSPILLDSNFRLPEFSNWVAELVKIF